MSFFETSLEDFLASPAERAQPVVRERPADLLTPVSAALRLFRPGQPCFLLESAEGGETVGRYSFLGLESVARCGGGGEDLESLRTFIDRHRVNPVTLPEALPGGAVGYLSYDAVRFFEDIPDRHRNQPTPPFLFHHFRDQVVFDHLKQRLYLVTLCPPAGQRREAAYREALQRLDHLEQTLNGAAPAAPPAVAGAEAAVQVRPDAETFHQAVARAQEYILSGDAYQVVLSRTFESPFPGHPLNLYRSLRMINPSPFMFFLDMGDHQIIGASPEDLVRVREGRVETLPIAGTRPRGADTGEDQELAEDLLADPKERAEHTMLVDLGRNDLGRISRPGSVEVERFMKVERFSHVMHLVSRVAGDLNEDTDALAALASCFPAGTVSGAPKIRAMEIIDELEDSARGIYAGSVAYFDGAGNLDSCIAIRTILLRDQVAQVRAGAGIVFDSVPEKEEEETRNKAKAMLKAIELAGVLP